MTRFDKLYSMNMKTLNALCKERGIKIPRNDRGKDSIVARLLAWEADSKQEDSKQEDSKQEDSKQEVKKTVKKSSVKATAESFLQDIPADSYTVDTKGRYNFKLFYLLFQRDSVTLAPTKQFREAHTEIEWEYHAGWSNKYRTAVSFETAKKAVVEALALLKEDKEA